jgi:hypothetical protein
MRQPPGQGFAQRDAVRPFDISLAGRMLQLQGVRLQEEIVQARFDKRSELNL